MMRSVDRQEQYITSRKTKEAIFREYPEIERLDRAKGRWMRFLMYYMLIYRIVIMTVIVQTRRSYPIILIGSCIMGYFIYCAFLSFCMGSRAQNVYLLYLSVLQALYTISKNYKNITSVDMLIQVYRTLFQSYPLAAVSDIMALAGLAFHLGVAVWLTLIPGNRQLAKQYDTLMQNVGVEKSNSSISAMARWTSEDEKYEDEKQK